MNGTDLTLAAAVSEWLGRNQDDQINLGLNRLHYFCNMFTKKRTKRVQNEFVNFKIKFKKREGIYKYIIHV